MSLLSNDLKQLTRKSLETTFKVQSCKLTANEMKLETVKIRIKEIVKDIAEHDIMDKKEITGRLKAVVHYIGMNSHVQFPEVGYLIDSEGLIGVTTKSNIWIGLVCMVTGFAVGVIARLIGL